jgi:hypothetical protein
MIVSRVGRIGAAFGAATFVVVVVAGAARFFLAAASDAASCDAIWVSVF